MKALLTPLFVIAAVCAVSSAAAAPEKSTKVAQTVSPFLDYKDAASIKKVITELGFTVGSENDGSFVIAADGNEYTMAIDPCTTEGECGSAALGAGIAVEKKPTDAWLVRMNEAGVVGRVMYLPAKKLVYVTDTFTINGINKDALSFNITNLIAEVYAVFDSMSKNEHLKK
jgi:Putative bacterial sensory transduction regulator